MDVVLTEEALADPGAAAGALPTRGHGVEQAGRDRLLLETGRQRPEAVALDESVGWTRTEAYGERRSSPLPVCCARDFGVRP